MFFFWEVSHGEGSRKKSCVHKWGLWVERKWHPMDVICGLVWGVNRGTPKRVVRENIYREEPVELLILSHRPVPLGSTITKDGDVLLDVGWGGHYQMERKYPHWGSEFSWGAQVRPRNSKRGAQVRPRSFKDSYPGETLFTGTHQTHVYQEIRIGILSMQNAVYCF